MSEQLSQQLYRLQNLNLSIRRSLEAAELFVPKINAQIEALFAVGMLEPQLYLGDTIHEAKYNSACGPEDSSVLVQAGLGVGYGGVGAVFWDALNYDDFVKHNRPIGGLVLLNFVAFPILEPAIRGLLLPHVGPLITRACKLIRVG